MIYNTRIPLNYAQVGVSEILNNPYTIYRTPTIILDDPLIFNNTPTQYEKLHYRIEFLKDGTTIYYKKQSKEKKFCCFF